MGNKEQKRFKKVIKARRQKEKRVARQKAKTLDAQRREKKRRARITKEIHRRKNKTS
jgi:hypothetical protein